MVNSITSCVKLPVSVNVAACTPVPATTDGPTVNHSVPVHTFNNSLVVSYHKSPVTLPVGAVELEVAALIVLKVVPLYTFNRLPVWSHQSWPSKGAPGGVVFDPFSNR